MSYKVELSDNFKREAKRLIKKYHSLKTELANLTVELETNPTKGIPLGDDIYKIRLAIASKGKGKSGGARIWTFVKVLETKVILFTIYNKGDQDNISYKEIKDLIKDF